jgi:hypothetical protein
VEHAPDEQTWPAGHAVPQDPQLALSLDVLAQYGAAPPSVVPPSGAQSVSVGPHVAEHIPAEHTWPAGHTVPQKPQLALSVFVFAQ